LLLLRDWPEMLRSRERKLKSVLIEVNLSLKLTRVKVVCLREQLVLTMPERMLKLQRNQLVSANLQLKTLDSLVVLK